MNNDFEDELDNLLHKYYGENWFFNWTGEDGGFQLILNVYNQGEDHE